MSGRVAGSGTGVLVGPRELVLPGTPLATGEHVGGPGTHREGDSVVASVVGLADVADGRVGVIALEGPYVPSPGDGVIGVVSALEGGVLTLDINAPWPATMEEGLGEAWSLGDAVHASVGRAASSRATLRLGGSTAGRLAGGLVVEVSPAKVPRVIGRSGSMVNLIKDRTGCRIVVGQNGRIWLKGEPEDELAAAEAVLLVESRAHTSGLTDAVRAFLEVRYGGKA